MMTTFNVNLLTPSMPGLSLNDRSLYSWQSHITPVTGEQNLIWQKNLTNIGSTTIADQTYTEVGTPETSFAQKAKMGAGGVLGLAASLILARTLIKNSNNRRVPPRQSQSKNLATNTANQDSSVKRTKEGSIKNSKIDVFDIAKNPFTIADIEAKFRDLFPGEEFVSIGNLDTGLVIYSTSNDLHILTVPSSALIPSAFEYLSHGRITKVIFGGEPGENHLKYSIVRLPNDLTKADIEKCVQAILENHGNLKALHTNDNRLREDNQLSDLILNGALQIGFERELWALDPITGEFAKIRNDELIVGCIEIDEGVYITPIQAASGMAIKQKELEKKYPSRLLVNTATPPSTSPQLTELNVYNEPHKEPNLGPYIAVIEGICYKRYKPFTSESLQIREQQAEFHGYPSALEMIREHGDCRTWSTAAAHMNLGVINSYNPKTKKYEVNFDLAKNLSNLALSEFGSIARMLTASSPYITGFAPKIDGKFTRDTREFIRQDMGTALAHNQPIRDAKHYREIVSQTMTQGADSADRLARAIVAHTNEDGTFTATAHGGGRWRFEDTGESTGRIEFTGAGSTSILPKARAMAVLQMIQALALLATHENKDVFTYIEENFGYSKQDVWGNADQTVQEFFLNGPTSTRLQTLIAKLKDVFEQIQIPGLEDSRQIALAALDGMLDEGDLHALAQGKGTLGGALITYAKEGYTGLEAAKIVHAFQSQEAEFIRSLDDEGVRKYLLGELGFEFVMPDLTPIIVNYDSRAV